jgi:ABC-type phosphate transport system substrate-binding protein
LTLRASEGRRALSAALFVSALLVCAGCGGGGDGKAGSDTSSGGLDAAISTQVKRYYAALSSADGKAACRLLTKSVSKSFEEAITGPASKDCATNVKTVSGRSGLHGIPKVTNVQRTGEDASAHVAFQDPPFETDVVLVRQGGSWLFAQLPATIEGGLGDAGGGGS